MGFGNSLGKKPREDEAEEPTLNAETLKEIDAMVAHFTTSDATYALKTEVAGFKDFAGVRHVDFGFMMGYILYKTKYKGQIDSRYLTSVMKRNPDLTKMAAKYIIETILPNQITQNIDDADKGPLKEEIKQFMGRNQKLIDGLSNPEDIVSIIETMYDMGTFLGRFQTQQTDEVPSMNRALLSGFKLYSHPKLQPVMQAFWDEYVKGGKKDGVVQDALPVTRKIIEGKGAKVIAPQYQAFFTHKPIQDTLVLPFKNPEKLTGFLTRTSDKLDQILAIGGSPKVSKFRVFKKWGSDNEKHAEVRRLAMEITHEFFEIYGPFFKELNSFLVQNKMTWDYFLKNGLRLKDRGDIREKEIKKGTIAITPDNALRGVFGIVHQGYSIEYMNSSMFMNGVMNPEALGLFFTAFILEIFDIWGEEWAKAEIGAEMRKYGINFNPITFGTMLNTTKGIRPEMYQKLADARDIMRFFGESDGKKLETLIEGWRKVFPKKD